MRLSVIAATTGLVLFSQVCFASTNTTLPSSSDLSLPSSRIAIQGALITGGIFSLGLEQFTDKTEIGASVSGSINNQSSPTKTVTPVIFGGLRQALCDRTTYFAYGVDLAGTFGEDHGQHIKADYAVGPYISLEQMLTDHVMLAAWIQPYQFEYKKVGASSVSTQSFFSTGGIAINYLF